MKITNDELHALAHALESAMGEGQYCCDSLTHKIAQEYRDRDLVVIDEYYSLVSRDIVRREQSPDDWERMLLCGR